MYIYSGGNPPHDNKELLESTLKSQVFALFATWVQ